LGVDIFLLLYGDIESFGSRGELLEFWKLKAVMYQDRGD